MRTLLLLFLTTYSSLQLVAQQRWKDYIIGRPISGYAEAKKATAQEWGINYEAILAGCILSDEISAQATTYEKSNAIYFHDLETKFGENWSVEFDLDVRKKMNLATSAQETRVLCEVVTELENSDFYAMKEQVAKKWGIHYKAKFVKGTISDTYRNQLQEDMLASNDYEQELNNLFDEGWKEALDKEVQLAVAKNNALKIPVSSTSKEAIWTDAVLGRPHMAFFEVKKEVAKEWGINYTPKFMGCVVSKKTDKELRRINKKNETYFEQLDQIYGVDWQVLFNRAVQKKFAQQTQTTKK